VKNPGKDEACHDFLQQQQEQHPWMTMDVDTMGTALTVLRLLMTTQAAEGRCAAADVMEQSSHKMMPMPHVLLTDPGCVQPLPAALYHKAGGRRKNIQSGQDLRISKWS
jgi:hypothetical protein